MADISPTIVMSASQKAKKVSILDELPLAAWITEIIETLNRPTGAVRVTKEHVTNVREQLSELNETGSEVNSQILEPILRILEEDDTACRRLKSDAMSLLIEVLLATEESYVRARGLYILAGSLHAERLGATRKNVIQARLDLIGQGCLRKLYDQFTEKSLPYNSRRWMGTLVLELIAECEDNQEIICLDADKQELGSCILYERSEILRSITGRVVTMMLAAEHPIKQFFSSATADKLFEKYPHPAQSASQWDKTFQEYVDDIWEDICADNESNGELQFAQSIVTEPPHTGLHAVAARHRSIYIELSDTVRVYIHAGNDGFDSAIDVPFASIEGINTTVTPIDGAKQAELVDVVLTIAQAAPCFVNSLQTPLSSLRLTVQDQGVADGIVNGISRMMMHPAQEDIKQQQVAASSPPISDSQGSSQSRKSCNEEDLVLDGSYTIVNDSFVEVPLGPEKPEALQQEEVDLEEASDDRHEVADVDQEKETKFSSKQTGPDTVTAIVATTAAAKQTVPAPKESATELRNIVEVDVVRDVDTGEVLTSKVLNMGVVASKQPGLDDDTVAKQAKFVIESSDQLAGDGLSSSDAAHERSAPIQDASKSRKAPLPKKQSLRSKAPIRGPKTGKETTVVEDNRTDKKGKKGSNPMMETFDSSPAVAEAPKKSRLTAPTKKSSKVNTKEQIAKHATGTNVEDDDIYEVISSPPRAKRDAQSRANGKKAAPPAKSSRSHGGKRKGKGNAIIDEVEEAEDVAEADRSPSRAKPLAQKKPLKKTPLETASMTARSKRTVAPRSTKGKKSMKDLSDSEIEELIVVEALIIEQDSIIRGKGQKTAAKSFPDTQRPYVGTQTSDMPKTVIKSKEKETGVNPDSGAQEPGGSIKAADVSNTVAEADHPRPVASLVAKKDVIGQAIVRSQPVASEPDDLQPLAEDEDSPSPAHEDKGHDPIEDVAVAASIEEGDDLDSALPSTAEMQKPAGTVEAKIGRKMAEIFGFAAEKVPPRSKELLQVDESPQKPSPPVPRSNPLLEGRPKSPSMQVDSPRRRPLSVDSDEIQAAMDDNEFLVLSSPPEIVGAVTDKITPEIAAPSTAQDPIVVLDADEEHSPAPTEDNKPAEKRTLATPSLENPSKRQRVAKAVVVSSPPQPAARPLSKRGAIKAKVQTRKQATPVPMSSALPPSNRGGPTPVDFIKLVDDHEARKTPLISFGPNGPRNQGLSSAVKAARTTKQAKPSTLSGILEKLSKQSEEQRPSPIEQPLQLSANTVRRQRRVPNFDDRLARFGSTRIVDRTDEEDDGMAFFDAEQSVASSRSHSRVDVNGSPQPKRPPLAPVNRPSRSAKKIPSASTIKVGDRRPQREVVAGENSSNDALVFDDDTTLLGSGFLSNRKVRPAAPGDDLDFEIRYTPHHSTENGTYLSLANQNVVDTAAHTVDPFINKVKRQDSDFARRLRMSAKKETQRAAQPPVPSTTKAPSRTQLPMSTVPQPSHLRSLVDADATLVDIENRPPQRSRKSRRNESSSDSSDSEAGAPGKDEPATPTPQQMWREALKPHQKDVSDVLHHVVDGLLQQLFDKEPAVQAIADEYKSSGTQIVEGLRSEMDEEVQALNKHAMSTIDDLAKNLRQSRAALQASSRTSREVDDEYRAWRTRQHELQSLPFMARPTARK